MKWIDVSVPDTVERPSWPGDPPFVYEETDTIAKGGVANCARMSLSVHFGTHVEGDGEHVRFSYASSFEAIDEGLRRVAEFMKRNKR